MAASSTVSSGSISMPASQSRTYSLFSQTSQTASVKLDRSNYLLWEAAVLALIEGNALESHIDGTVIQPSANAAQREEQGNRSTDNSSGQNAWRGGNGSRGGPRGGRGGRQRGGGRRGGNSNGGSRPYCHLCEKTGHVVANCYYRFDKTFQPPYWQNSNVSGSTPNQAQAFYATPQTVDDASWYVDSGATHHVTPHTDQFESYAPVGDRTKITGIGFLNKRVPPVERSGGDQFPILVVSRDGVNVRSETEDSTSSQNRQSSSTNGAESSTGRDPTVQIFPTDISPVASVVPRDVVNLNEESHGLSRDLASSNQSYAQSSSSNTAGPTSSEAQDDTSSSSSKQLAHQHNMITRARDGIHKPKLRTSDNTHGYRQTIFQL
ncbi:Retrovirus-related Pol polyprotein from transposon RE1 [Senna tora]|uniref:Retrovirus-related Pol polyprotein from transposon RE1 n=1 Tax=Senna tora TaxID=362788 RepID=A0A834XFS3_9FABA|nr:Retrovirus-related Pol polyprotein from transposon RE1 [Senna tora]